MSRIVPARIKHAAITPAGFCPPDLQVERLFYAPLQRNLSFYGQGSASFIRATAATYVHQDTDQITVAASGEARFEAHGYLAEDARTNLLFPSDDFEDAAWTNSNITVLAAQTGVGGAAAAASKLTAAAGNATLINDLGVIASAATNGSLYIERVTGTGDIDVTLDGGAGWTTVAVGATFALFSIQQTLANPDFGIRIVTSGDEILVQAAQAEAGTFASSRIPTTSGTAVRNSDQLVWAGQAVNINSPEGTVYCEADAIEITYAGSWIEIDDASSTDRLSVRNPGSVDRVEFNVRANSVNTANFIVANGVDDLVNNTMKAMAMAWKVDDVEFFTSGESRGTDTSAAMAEGLTDIGVGRRTGDAAQPFGHIRNLQIFATRLSSNDVGRIR